MAPEEMPLDQAIARFLDGEPIHARPVSAAARLVRWAKRKPAIAGLLASIVAVTLIAFVTISSGLYTYSDETHNVGTSAHTCGVTTTGVTYCWGDNIVGELGTGGHGDGQMSAVPVKVAGQP